MGLISRVSSRTYRFQFQNTMSKWGKGHPKALEKRERTANTKNAAQLAKQKAKEDAYWHDPNKELEKKQDRALEREEKRQAEIDKKAELKKLYEEENSTLSVKPNKKANKQYLGKNTKKLTKAQIQAHKMKEFLAREQEMENNKKGKIVMVDEQEIVENIN